MTDYTHFGNGNVKRKYTKCGAPADIANDTVEIFRVTCPACLKCHYIDIYKRQQNRSMAKILETQKRLKVIAPELQFDAYGKLIYG